MHKFPYHRCIVPLGGLIWIKNPRPASFISGIFKGVKQIWYYLSMAFKDPKTEKTYQIAYYQANATRLKKANIDRKRAAKEKWTLFKSTLKCANCGENHPATLDFHHVEKHPDNRHVYNLTSNGAYKKAIKEIEKCIVLCANCHRKVHYEERIKNPTSL